MVRGKREGEDVDAELEDGDAKTEADSEEMFRDDDEGETGLGLGLLCVHSDNLLSALLATSTKCVPRAIAKYVYRQQRVTPTKRKRNEES